MPSASKIIGPLKDVFRGRGSGTDDNTDDGVDPQSLNRPPPSATEPCVARDFVGEPIPAQGGESQVSIDTTSSIQPGNGAIDPGSYPPAAALQTDSSISVDKVHPLDAQSDLASAQTFHRAEGFDSDEDEEEHKLTYSQLRRLYDDEEIERFLTVFSKYVTEVTLAPSEGSKKPKKATVLRSSNGDEQPLDTDVIAVDDSDAETDIDEPWTYLNHSSTDVPSVPNATVAAPEQPPVSQGNQTLLHPPNQPKYLSARVAAWLIPRLPPAPISPPSKFKISSVRLAGQRVYVSTYPVYAPFFADLAKLATWTDWYRSARVCTTWWIFWYFNLLLPALLGKVLCSLLRRRVFPHPNVKELRERRRLAREANQLSDAMEGQGAATSFLGTGPIPGVGQGGGDMGIRDMWKLVRTVTKGKSKKGKEKVKNAGEAVASQVGLSEGEDEEAEAQRRRQEDEDWRTGMVKALEDIADLHERVRNLFLWRREQSSRMYSLVLTIIVLFTALTPAQWLAKITYAVIGILYWFAVPVVLAMPPEDRKRIPPPFFDVPTDAEYAMSLMSIRVANGESVLPASRRGGREHGRARRFLANMSVDSVAGKGPDSDDVEWDVASPDQDVDSMRKEANEKEAEAATERAATAAGEPAAPVGTLGRLKNQVEQSTADLLARNQDDSNVSLQSIGAPQTVPANHKAVPGTLSLSSQGISFTPLLTSTPSMQIPLENIRGVKKTGRTNGLRVRYLSDQGEEKESVFRFIPSRDEIFGKLVGWGGRRWKKVP